VKPYGGAFGAYYDFKDLGPVRIGVDLRGDVLGTNKRADSSAGGQGIVRQYATLGGLRGSIKTPIHWLRPYAEVAGGYTRNNAIGQYTFAPVPSGAPALVSFNPNVYANYGVVRGYVGADITIFPFLDLRAIELGAGEAFGSSSHTTESIGAGIVFHLPR
jgi:hypothetical protein